MANRSYSDLYNDFFGESTPAPKPKAPAGEAARSAEAAIDAVSRSVSEMQSWLQQKSGELTRELARDGLLDASAAQTGSAPAAAAAPGPEAPAACWKGLAEAVSDRLPGQKELLVKLERAFRRPTVITPVGQNARNVIYLYGGSGSGRRTALRLLTEEMARRGLLSSPRIDRMDLSLYPGPAQEKLFLQDLYEVLVSPAEVILFDNWQVCSPACRTILSDLAQKGSTPLSSRYVLQRGILVESGTALVNDAVSELTPKGKYLVFLGKNGPEKLAGSFGASFVDCLGDICCTADYQPETLAVIAGRSLNDLTQRARQKLGFELKADTSVRDWLAGRYCRPVGVQGIVDAADKLFRGLAEYKLSEMPDDGLTVTLTAPEGEVLVQPQGGEALALAALLPAGYTGEQAAAEAELDAIVGLAQVKDYVRGLADNVAAQARRKAAGLPVTNLNMHMIFAGNPGTGKTTIARIVAKYLKAIGALRGGQLVEVSRADLVGRYVGHTAPLTNSVIQSALGGVLFIDEAYSLFRGREDSFGLEAIDTLVKGIEDHRDDLVVVLAGYSREMAEFLTANSGLASRFPNHIEFPDYTAAELLAITHSIARSKGYRLDPACELPLNGYFERRQATDPATAGNGRMARNLLEKAILNQSRRLAADPEAPLDEILPQDLSLEEE